MNEIDQLALLAELYGETCQLNHGCWHPEDPRAIDYLVIPIGYNESQDVQVQTREITIPICKDCQETLYEDDGTWLLFVCTNCSHSKWAVRDLLRNQYPPGVLQPMKYCPM